MTKKNGLHKYVRASKNICIFFHEHAACGMGIITRKNIT